MREQQPELPTHQADASELIERRVRNMAAWLNENGPECMIEQANLDDGSRKRFYWDYGYKSLKDVRKEV